MFARAIRAALLRRKLYHEVREDPEAILNALGIVVLVGMAIGFSRMGVLVGGTADPTDLGSLADRAIGMWLVVMTTLVGWVLWTGVVYLLVTKFLGGGADFRLVLRSLGFGYAPGVLLALGPVPVIGDPLFFVGLLWVLVAGVVAVHEPQEADWLGSFLATFLGWFLCFLLLPSYVIETLLA